MDKFRWVILAIILILCIRQGCSPSDTIELPVIPSVVVPVPEEKVELQLKDIPKYRSIEEDTIYGEVLNYSKSKPFGDEHGRPTNVHETAHGISSDIRNEYYKNYECDIEALYYGNGKAIILEQPKLLISNIPKHIPESLRSYRFKLYFVDQLKYWDSSPLYILDEWVAYIWGARCALEDYEKSNIHTKEDSVSGSLEFSIYVVGLCLAIKERDNNYWNTNKELKFFVKERLEIAEKVFFQGKDIFKSQKQDELLDNFRQLDSDEPIKAMLRSDFNSVFLRKL